MKGDQCTALKKVCTKDKFYSETVVKVNTGTMGLDQHRPIDRLIIGQTMLVKKIECENARKD